jgi:hypothetical protein
MNHDCMQRSMTDRHTAESVGDKKLSSKQETATKLACTEFQQKKLENHVHTELTSQSNSREFSSRP